MMWIYILIFFFTASRAITQGTTNSNIIVNTTTSPLKVYVNRKEVFNLGSDARLICSNKTQNKSIFVIWNIELKHKTCKISFSNEGQNINSCNDGKSIQISNDQSFLHIPNFSASDVGVYSCESTYTGGNENYRIAVGVTAPPAVSTWLERRGKKIVAVCRAERGIPAANISWSVIGNHSVTQQNDPDGLVTVESQLEVPEDTDHENLTCIVRHQFWEQKTFKPRFRAPPAVSTWLEQRGNKIVAVCRAERGIPAANIMWSLTRNHSVTQQNDPDGFVTVESQLEVPKDIKQNYLTCIVRHPFWEQERTFISRFRELNPWIRIVVVFVVLILGLLIFALRKRRCQP